MIDRQQAENCPSCGERKLVPKLRSFKLQLDCGVGSTDNGCLNKTAGGQVHPTTMHCFLDLMR